MKRSNSGFTIVELLIVIVVIGILAATTLAAYSGTQARARDTIRIDNLEAISDALTVYYANNGDWIETGSGCGGNGNGTGWFNYTNGTTYLQSISNCLKVGGYTKEEIIDPTGGTSSTPSAGYTYMKYHCGSGAAERIFVYAKLETKPQDTTATDGTCATTVDSSYGMNYYVQVK